MAQWYPPNQSQQKKRENIFSATNGQLCQKKDAHRVAFLQTRYGVALVGRAMGNEVDISPLREASDFGAGIDRCVVIEILAHKNGLRERTN